MNAYNFDNIDFDIDLGEMSEKQHKKALQDEKIYQEELDKQKK